MQNEEKQKNKTRLLIHISSFCIFNSSFNRMPQDRFKEDNMRFVSRCPAFFEWRMFINKICAIRAGRMRWL